MNGFKSLAIAFMVVASSPADALDKDDIALTPDARYQRTIRECEAWQVKKEEDPAFKKAVEAWREIPNWRLIGNSKKIESSNQVKISIPDLPLEQLRDYRCYLALEDDYLNVIP